MAEPAGGIGRYLTGVIPLGVVRAAVTFAPDEKHLCGVRHRSQAARERNRLLRSLDRPFADDLRQARFAAIRGDDLGNNQHVGTGQTAVQTMNGENIFPGAQPLRVCGNIERLELHCQ